MLAKKDTPDAMIPTWNFQDQVVLVTGASSGIGKATAKAFHDAGAQVALLGLHRKSLQQAADDIAGEGDKARLWTVQADISVPDDIESGINTVLSHFGKLDVLFANAGINGVWAPIGELEPDEWNKTISTNLTGTFLTMKYSTAALRESQGAAIICSSVNGTRVFSNTGATAYSCTKAGLIALTKMLALELADDGVRVNAVCPGAIDTPIQEKTIERDLDEVQEPVDFLEGRIPLTDGRQGAPNQVAQVVLFLASPSASHVTGTQIFIDGAESLLQG